MIPLLLALAAPVFAADHHVVRAGDTVASIAAALGDPSLEGAILKANGLTRADPLEVGAVLLLPDRGARPPEAVLHSYFGTGSITPPGGAAAAFDTSLPLPEGTTVCTDADSFATLRLASDADGPDHDDVNLWPDTCLEIRSLAARAGDRSSLINVTRGSVSVQAVRKGETQGTITVTTADAVATSRGGGHRVHVEDGATRTEALYNPLAVIAQGVELDLQPGQGSRIKAGEAPGKPVQLLVPGTPSAPDAGLPLRVPDFEWTPVDRALGYVLEIGLDAEFRDIVLLEDLPGPAYAPELLIVPWREDGLWWRVTSYDRMGFMGVPSDPRPQRFPIEEQP
ncbi:MAG: LysM peptidoglycan-binding domain-containing protein [Alphaproteobacteria bacterium]|nr:LysM peptidoglycan-binding domain-containing protein [Alphaproteobacteria bacterium]